MCWCRNLAAGTGYRIYIGSTGENPLLTGILPFLDAAFVKNWPMRVRLSSFTIYFVAVSVVIQGCASQGFEQARKQAETAGASTAEINSEQFSHRVFEKAGNGRHLRIYFHGDGKAFLSRNRVSRNPTPHDHLALKLMLSDPGPAVMLGRPCFYLSEAAAGCSATLWTSRRYSEVVINSMGQAVERIAARYPGHSLNLVGFSGGGAIALLVAARNPSVERVITVAAPLDTQLWTEIHGYTPLEGSLNPSKTHSWPPNLVQVHYYGSGDREVPPGIFEAFRDRFSAEEGVTLIPIEGFDHRCCWVESWPELLSRAMALSSSPRKVLPIPHQEESGSSD
jgi:hypothetical protein